MALKEYKPGQAFSGVIGRTADVSKPAWPAPIRARDGAPNVLFIVLDDTGFVPSRSESDGRSPSSQPLALAGN
jgi:hypothetical protein